MIHMKLFTAILKGAIMRAFTKKNGAILPTTTPEGVWDLEATVAWFLRAVLLLGVLYLAKHFGVDPQLVLTNIG